MENNEKRSFGEFITQRRKALGMTQREFADKLFVTDSAVSKWERGMSYPDITLIRDICAILGVSEHELLTAGVDVEARSAEKLAARYRRMAKNYKLAQYILYGGAALVCLICDLADGGGFGWSLIALASLLMAASLTLLPALAPERMGGVWAMCGFAAALLAAAIPTGGTDYLWSESYPLMLLGLLWPWLMLGCLRYLPVSRRHRAAAACAVSAAYIWLAPWGVDAILKVNGWASSLPYDPLNPYNADLGDWLSPAAIGGNIMVTVMALLALAAAVLTVTGFRRRK